MSDILSYKEWEDWRGELNNRDEIARRHAFATVDSSLAWARRLEVTVLALRQALFLARRYPTLHSPNNPENELADLGWLPDPTHKEEG